MNSRSNLLSRRSRAVLALPLLVGLGGCAAASAVANLNPFAPPEARLAGERQSIVLSSNELSAQPGAVRPVAVPPPSANAEWAQPGGVPSNSVGHLAYSGSLAPAWKANVGTAGRRNSGASANPVVHQGRVYALDGQGQVTAVSAQNGAPLWVASLKPEGEGRGGATGGGVAAANGTVFAATGFGTIGAFSAESGAPIWQKRLDAPARSAPTVANGRIFVTSANNVVYALRASDGGEIWTYRGIPETAGFLTSAAPAVSGKKVIVPFSSGELMAFDADSGKGLWLDALTRSGGVEALTGINDVSARPVVDGGTVFAVSVSGRMIAVDEASGERIWTKNVASAYTPIVAGEVVYVLTLRGELVALDRRTGDVRWLTPLPAQTRNAWAGPILAGNRLWVTSTSGQIIGVDPSTGQIAGPQIAGEPSALSPIVASGRLYVLGSDGDLVAYN